MFRHDQQACPWSDRNDVAVADRSYRDKAEVQRIKTINWMIKRCSIRVEKDRETKGRCRVADECLYQESDAASRLLTVDRDGRVVQEDVSEEHDGDDRSPCAATVRQKQHHARKPRTHPNVDLPSAPQW